MKEFIRSYQKHYDYDGTYPLTRYTLPLRVGDYGIFNRRKKQFEKRGHISEWSTQPDLFETEFGLAEERSGFAAFYKRNANVDGEGDIGPVVEGKIKFGFEQQGGCLLQLDGSQVETFKHRQKVINELARFKGAKEFDVIFAVKRAKAGVLLVSDSSEWSLEASGGEAILKVGRLASAGITLSTTSGSGTITNVPPPDARGTMAPVAFEVYGTRWYDPTGKFRRLDASDQTSEGAAKFGRVDLFAEADED